MSVEDSDLNLNYIVLLGCNDFQVILKQRLLNYQKILKKCFICTTFKAISLKFNRFESSTHSRYIQINVLRTWRGYIGTNWTLPKRVTHYCAVENLGMFIWLLRMKYIGNISSRFSINSEANEFWKHVSSLLILWILLLERT